MNFKNYWALIKNTESEILIKSSSKLSKADLMDIQKTIFELQKKGYNATKIIKYLQDHNSKLADEYKAQRAFWTELKRMDTEEVKESGKILDLDKYEVILSPHACPVCRKKTRNGTKVFTGKDLHKSGYGHYPPFHPNCYCILIPR